MATRLSIANAAYAELDEEPLEFASQQDADRFTTGAVLEDEDDQQRKISAIYPQIRSTLLNAYPWSWLTTQARLEAVPLATGEQAAFWPFQHRYRSPLPRIGSIRALFSRPRHDSVMVNGWAVQGRFIYANFSPAWAEYQTDLDEEQWPDLFVNAAILALAARLAPGIKEDVPTTRDFERKAELALSTAKRVDAQSQPAPEVVHFEWLAERVSGGFQYGRER